MANSFAFKRTETTSVGNPPLKEWVTERRICMKITGILDAEKMVVESDNGDKALSTLLSPFDGATVEMYVKVKSEEELDEPGAQD